MPYKINGSRCHEELFKKPPALAFSPDRPFGPWREQVKEKLVSLLGLARIAENACPLHPHVEESIQAGTYRRIRFTYESEHGSVIPAYLLFPSEGSGPFPLAVVLQGHGTGFHNSVGISRFPGEEEYQKSGAMGLQAVEQGFAALCIELRGMGELSAFHYAHTPPYQSCSFSAMQALSLGRTLMGERVWDISRGLDALAELGYPEIDLGHVMLLGFSGGGTAAFYTACCDERPGLCVPVCSFSSYERSILAVEHCPCNFIPESRLWFEAHDLAALIAPRRLVVVRTQRDNFFPIEGARAACAQAEAVYEAAGASGRFCSIETPDKHFFNKEAIWQAIMEQKAQLGWQ